MPALLWLLPLAGLLLALVAGAAPLALYSVTLAPFGLAHVLCEFAYVDRRFGRRLNRAQVVLAIALLAGAAGFRAAGVFAVLMPGVALGLELACVVLLVLAVTGAGRAGIAGLVLALPLALAAALAPFATATVLSIAHNFTPLAFLWEVLAARGRRILMVPVLATFLGVPALVVGGWPRMLLGDEAGGGDPLGSGGLIASLHVYVPPFLADGPAALDLFAASAAAQGLHYLCVIVILPLLLGAGHRGLLPWSRTSIFAALVVFGSLMAFGGFLRDFGTARGIYGIVASVHAWAELPLIALILGGRLQPIRTSPARKEMPLAMTESSSAGPA
ncbi:MAG: hypothetical protein PHS60_08185 [Zavarzinia sp.]|nr:hypothetical protein [Zavarzinia sp.]